MATIYSGDIKGTLGVRTKSRITASCFGGMYWEPSHITFYYDHDDLTTVESGMRKIEKQSGPKLNLILDLLKTNNGTINKKTMIEQKISLKEISVANHYILGMKIKDCIIKNNKCQFDVEIAYY